MAPASGALALVALVAHVAHENTFAVGYPKFCVSQARLFVVLGVCPSTCVVPLRSVSSVLDTLTSVFELYIRLRERWQWDSDFCFYFPLEFLLLWLVRDWLSLLSLVREAHPLLSSVI
ncbi:hypothetical protein Taro_023817 [Colocasia esculenta]|uniref:Uncharacterized protein n=1 Tax=Colocasia esculenta TaxID=4460 RepID=A0A843V562_COLES|nr:hypothetical protein [Colocasia esculenta]